MMRNKVLFWKIFGLVTVIILLFAAYSFYVVGESRVGSQQVTKGKPLSFTVGSRYVNLFIELEASTYGCKEKIRYSIKSPDNRILQQDEIPEGDTLKLDSKFPGYKGTWNIEFENLAEDEAIDCEYRIVTRNINTKER